MRNRTNSYIEQLKSDLGKGPRRSKQPRPRGRKRGGNRNWKELIPEGVAA